MHLEVCGSSPALEVSSGPLTSQPDAGVHTLSGLRSTVRETVGHVGRGIMNIDSDLDREGSLVRCGRSDRHQA